MDEENGTVLNTQLQLQPGDTTDAALDTNQQSASKCALLDQNVLTETADTAVVVNVDKPLADIKRK